MLNLNNSYIDKFALSIHAVRHTFIFYTAQYKAIFLTRTQHRFAQINLQKNNEHKKNYEKLGGGVGTEG